VTMAKVPRNARRMGHRLAGRSGSRDFFVAN
jgi:hypothetical protein